MRLLRKAWYPIPVTLVLGLFGCADHPMASEASHQGSSEGFFDGASAPGFGALEWLEPLDQEIEAYQVIGPAGGTIELLGTGIEIRFPEGAVSEGVLIEARAFEGSIVAFEFGAPGLTVGVPIEIRIDGDGLAGPFLQILGVFFEEDADSEITPLVAVPIMSDGGSILFEVLPEEVVKRRVLGFAVASG